MLPKKLLIVVLLISVLGIPHLLTAQDVDVIPRWSAPEFLDDGWFPSIVTDQTGTSHILWSQQRVTENLDDLLYYTQRNILEERSDPLDVIYTGGGGFTIRSAIDVTSDGVLKVAFRQGTGHYTAQAPLDRALNTQEWIVGPQFSNGYYVDMTVDQSDNIHLVSSSQGINIQVLGLENADPLAIQERFPCAFCSDLLYFRSTDGGETWSNAVNISQTIGGSERMDIFEGHSGRLFITWSEGSDWYIGHGDYEDVRLVYSDNQGETWSDTIVLSGNQPGLHPTQVTATEMFDGRVFVVWRYDDINRDIYYQISDPTLENWSEPTVVPDIVADLQSVSTLDQYDLVTDLSGAVHLFAVGYDPVTEQGPALYHMEYRQDQWLRPDRVYYNPDIDRPEWPAAAVGPRNEIHLAWFVRVGDKKNEADVGSTHVYFAYRTPTLPNNPVMVAYAPTPTPVPRVAVIPAFQATATIVPTFAPLDPGVVVDTNRDQYAIQTLVGAVIAVIALCSGVLIIVGFRPRSF